MEARDLDRRVRIERPEADDAWDGAGSGEWVLVADVWANVRDVLPSRSEKLSDGAVTSTRRSRIRIRRRSDVTSSMRFVVGGRAMQIISGPADLIGRRFQEFMVEETTPAGNGA